MQWGFLVNARSFLLEFLHVFRLRTFRAFDDVKADAIAFIEGFEPLALDRGKVNKHVRPVVLLDETEPFCLIKPFDCSLCQFDSPCSDAGFG